MRHFLALCLFLLPFVARGDNLLILSNQSSAPTCTGSKSCVYSLTTGGYAQIKHSVLASAIRLGDSLGFRSSAACSGLASPANGDVCFDTVLGTTLYYSAGWKTFVNTGRTISTTAPLSGGGDLSANRTLSISAGGLVYSSVTGAGKGALGAATVYLVGPGVVAIGTTEAVLLVGTRAGTARNLYCDLGTAPGGADTVVFTARLNAADQATTCTISAANTTCNDTSNTFAVVAGNRLSIKAVSSAGLASDAACSFEVTN